MITLHPTLGVNPHLTYCPRCGGDTNEIMLIGTRTTIRKCAGCGIKIYGHGWVEPCPKCKHKGPHDQVGRIMENDKLPGSTVCDACAKELAAFRKVVDKGGVYFYCAECKHSGVIKASAAFSKAFRRHHNIAAPNPIGVEFDKCSQHGDKEKG